VTRQLSILIVDDEFGLAEMMRDLLRDYGYDVSLAINGRLALDVLHEQPVDLVITDAMMPVMDGPELASAIRTATELRRIPIVLMTSLPTAAVSPNGLFDAVLRKPFPPDLLLETLRTCLSDRRDAGPIDDHNR